MKINREHVHSKYGGRCAYCGQEITLKQMQVDHYYPKRMPNIDVNHIDNLMPACKLCNHYKRAQMPEVWRVTMMTLHKRIENIYINKVGVNFGMVTIKPWDGKFYFEKQQKHEKD